MAALNSTYRTAADSREVGKAARARLPRRYQGVYEPFPGRPDPVGAIELEGESRVTGLLPLRYHRMSDSAFTFYRGAAPIMAYDLAQQHHSGLITQLCGDMHLSNLGFYGSPERRLLFDVNDFDETLPGPFEWDLKRLVASFVIAGQHRGFKTKHVQTAALTAAASYRQATQELAASGLLDVWYSQISDEDVIGFATAGGFSEGAMTRLQKGLAKARSRDSNSAVMKMTEVVDGERRFIEDPPVIMRNVLGADLRAALEGGLNAYRRTLVHDRRRLLDRYRLVDTAFKVVGVGSVGTRAFIMLMQGRDERDLLVLQAKEAGASCLEPYLSRSQFKHPGQRVVEGQRFMQAVSDIMLGWATGPRGHFHFYLRQLRDMKGSVDTEAIRPEGLIGYAKLCGLALARAHARGGDPLAVATYLGNSDSFDRAMLEYGLQYAEQNQADYKEFMDAIKSGRLVAKDETQLKSLKLTM